MSFAISLFALLLDMYHSYIKSKKEPPRWIVFMVFTLTPASMMSHLGLSVKAHEKQVENIKKEIEVGLHTETPKVLVPSKTTRKPQALHLQKRSLKRKSILKPRLRVTCYAEALARGQLAELYFWKFRKVFPYQSNSQNFFKFYCHFLGRRARGVFPVPLAFAKKFSSFTHWLKNGGVLRGSGRGGLNLTFTTRPRTLRSIPYTPYPYTLDGEGSTATIIHTVILRNSVRVVR